MVDIEKNDVVKCKTGNIIEVIVPNTDADANNMEIFEEKTEGEGEVKHVPVVTYKDDRYIVNIGEVEHPMEPEHYIAMIEVIADGQSHKQLLNPGEKPQAEFIIPESDNVVVREYCTVHGLWKKE